MGEDDARGHMVERTLAKPDVHREWQSAFLTTENEKFYDLAFDRILRAVTAPPGSVWLDAGCGMGSHAVRLAHRGFRVEAIDFADSVLTAAAAHVKRHRVETLVQARREDLRRLSYRDETFTYILCWGVLMHVPDFEKALSELVRVLKPGGWLVVSEGNMDSLQSRLRRSARRILGTPRSRGYRLAAGVEYWHDTPAGPLLTREANIGFFLERCRTAGLIVKQRMSGQFTEVYTRVRVRRLQRLVHLLNAAWFKYVGWPHVAFANILILRKEYAG